MPPPTALGPVLPPQRVQPMGVARQLLPRNYRPEAVAKALRDLADEPSIRALR